MLKLYEHQKNALNDTNSLNKVAYYHDMGLGKTFTGAEKMMNLHANINLVICQKSKINDWVEHFKKYYANRTCVYNLTNKKEYDTFIKSLEPFLKYGEFFYYDKVAVINYELAFRREELSQLKDFTLMLDESSLIQNENAKRSKFILNKLKPTDVILLSGTPTGGKYEKLWSQLHLLGWNISKKLFLNTYVNVEYLGNLGFSIPIVKGYKNVDRLKRKMHDYGCHFLKTDEVFDLPLQNFQTIKVSTSKEYRKFKKDCIVMFLSDYPVGDSVEYKSFECMCDDGIVRLSEIKVSENKVYELEFVGDTTLTKMLYERQLCGVYNVEKLNTFRDLVESTSDRIVVFYNFNNELNALRKIAFDYTEHVSIVNGNVKNLTYYEEFDDSITFIQYQAGAMGLNLQKANKIIYFTPPISSELFEQSKKRIHRIGQDKPCFYYLLSCKNSVEEKIYGTLELRKDYTEALFEKGK